MRQPVCVTAMRDAAAPGNGRPLGPIVALVGTRLWLLPPSVLYKITASVAILPSAFVERAV